jgi:tetrahydromethanopterin S-methyltransferase subunit G
MENHQDVEVIIHRFMVVVEEEEEEIIMARMTEIERKVNQSYSSKIF